MVMRCLAVFLRTASCAWVGAASFPMLRKLSEAPGNHDESDDDVDGDSLEVGRSICVYAFFAKFGTVLCCF